MEMPATDFTVSASLVLNPINPEISTLPNESIGLCLSIACVDQSADQPGVGLLDTINGDKFIRTTAPVLGSGMLGAAIQDCYFYRKGFCILSFKWT